MFAASLHIKSRTKELQDNSLVEQAVSKILSWNLQMDPLFNFFTECFFFYYVPSYQNKYIQVVGTTFKEQFFQQKE